MMKTLLCVFLLISQFSALPARAQTAAPIEGPLNVDLNNVNVKINNVQGPMFQQPHTITVNLENQKTKDTLQMQYEINLQKAFQDMSPTMMYKMNGGVARTVSKNIRMETMGFLAGVGLNSLETLMLNYEHDPMATEKFIETLKDPVGYMGLAAFIFSTNYTNYAFNSLLYSQFMSQTITPSLQRKVAQILVPQLGMIMGGLASNALHDIATLTQACATVIMDRSVIQSKKAQICDETMKMTFSSEKFYQYTTQSISMVSSGFFIAGMEGASLYAKDKALNAAYKKLGMKIFLRQALTLRGVSIAASRLGRFIPHPAFKIIASGMNLAIFMKVDEHIFFPRWNYFIEKNLKAGPDLIESRDYLKARLSGTESQASGKNIANLNFTLPKKSYSLLSIIEGQPQNDADTNMAGVLKTFREDSAKWREKLMESFTIPYMNWLTKVARFSSMASMAQEYYKDFSSTVDSYYSAQKNPNLVEAIHPFYFDTPYYGVIPRDEGGKVVKEDSITLVEQLNKYKLNTLKSAVPMLQKALVMNAPTINPRTKQKRDLPTRNFIQTTLEKIKYAFSSSRRDLHRQALIDLAYLSNVYSGDKALFVEKSIYLGKNADVTKLTPQQIFADSSMMFTSQESILKQIYTFVGEPLPLGRGELYALEWSRYYQETQPAFYKEYGKVPGYTLMKNIVCGPDQANIHNSYYLPGTSLVFTPPKLIKVKKAAEQKTLCASSDTMNSTKTLTLQLQKHSYDTAPTALLDYAIQNYDPQLLAVKGGDFDTWWMTYVYPGIQKTFEDFNVSFNSMVKKELLPKFTDKQESSSGLAQDMTSAYLFELQRYVDVLMKTYIAKDDAEQKLFVSLITDYRAALWDTLNSYKKNEDVRPQYVKTLALYKMIKRLFTFSDANKAVHESLQQMPEQIKRMISDRYRYYSKIAGPVSTTSFEYVNELELRLVLDKWMDDQIFENALTEVAQKYSSLSPIVLNSAMKGDGVSGVQTTLNLMMALHEDVYQISGMIESLSNEKHYSNLQQNFELKKGSGSRNWGP